MTIDGHLTKIQKHISNRLNHAAIGDRRIAGVIGDAPSHYSKSPALWNAAFKQLRMDAIYLPFDLDNSHLRDFVAVLRDCDRFLGINVTVPHKVRIMDLLDERDAVAERVQAVNTVTRTSTGKLIGHNTDGEGFVQSILTLQPGRKEAFIQSLAGIDVLLLGAGGAARAVAVHLSDHMKSGKLVISNRTLERAACLAAEIQKLGRNAVAIGEPEVPAWAPKCGLIINSTTKGQGGLRKLSRDEVTTLEFFSSLAPAEPTILRDASGNDAEIQQRWTALAGAEIEANHKVSLAIAASIPVAAGFYDLIYHPEETVFLRHGRQTGHSTMNGKAMIINQAVIALCKHVCGAELRARGIDNVETARAILEVMYNAW
jgi:shikimate dehydrogenase